MNREKLQNQLKRSLAESLYMEPSDIDTRKSFVDIGLDSIVGVEWVNRLNKQYKLSLSATRVYDYSNIQDLASFLEKEIEDRATSIEEMPEDTEIIHADTRLDDNPTEYPIPPKTPISGQQFHPASYPILKRRNRVSKRIQEVSQDAAVPAVAKEKFSDKVAVIGMSGRYPQASNLDEYWDNLSQGKNSIVEIPVSRWDVQHYYDPNRQRKGKVYSKWLGMLEEADLFDPLFFQISPAEAEIMDPQHRLFMQESYRAFEHAGYSSESLNNIKCGVYLGIMSNEYSLMLSRLGSVSVDTTANSFAIGAARIAYYLNLKGPAIPVDTACSSSLVTIHLACQGLLNSEIDMALAGGVSLYLTPESYIGMCQAGMLSADGQCKTFDDSADGFVPGEGVGAVILKRLADAERDKDFIYGVILGSAINQDGKTNGITAPSVNSQIELERDLYNRYGIDPATISYVETHGTGTKLGDPIELEALRTVFEQRTSKRNYCALGSVKSNIGHTSGAAGVASVQKVLLSMQHKTLVPSLNVKTENTLFNFEESPFYISKDKKEWKNDSEFPRRAAVSSFGFSGTNAHLVLEEYPRALDSNDVNSIPGDEFIVPFSAKTQEQLVQKLSDFINYLSRKEIGSPEKQSKETSSKWIDLQAIAYTLQVGRAPMRERLAFVVNSVRQLKEKVQLYISGRSDIDNCFKGEINSSADALSLFSSDGDFGETIDKWIETSQFSKLANLWVKGLDLDWNKLYREVKPNRVGLPTYPFAKQRYWIDLKKQPRISGSENIRESLYSRDLPSYEQKKPLYYVSNWRELSLPELEESKDNGKQETFLVIYPSDMLSSVLKGTRESTVLVESGKSFMELNDNHYCIGSDLESDILQLVRKLTEQGRFPSKILHAFPDDADSGDRSISRRLEKGVYTLFYLFKALMKQKHRKRVALISIFSSESENSMPENEALASFFQSLALENPWYQGRVVEICKNGEKPADSDSYELMAGILREFTDKNSQTSEVRYKYDKDKSGYRRYIKDFVAYMPSVSTRNIPLKQNGVYLITGGLGGLGYTFSEYLARNYKAKLVLTGRSALDGEVKSKYESLISLGADVEYLQADVSSLEEMERVLRESKARFSAINGVIHSAGINRDSFLLNKTKEQLDEVIRPKVDGTRILDELTKGEPLDLFIMFSSVASIKGNLGQCDYAYANHYMDSFALRRSELVKENIRCGQTLSINWPLWEGVGMTISSEDIEFTEKHTGMSPMPVDIGIRFWEDYICSGVPRGVALYGIQSRIETYLNPIPRISDKKDSEVIGPNSIDYRTDDVVSVVEAYLKKILSEEIKLDPEQVDSHERFEAYGIDSIVIGRLNARLQEDFGELPKTLFYEYETISKLAQYLAKESGSSLNKQLAFEDTTPRVQELDPSTEASPLSGNRANHNNTSSECPEQIAIIGVHGIFPGSENLDEYWNNLRKGVDSTGLVPRDRWNYREFHDDNPEKSSEGKIYCKWGGFIDCFDKFDHDFFNIPIEEANIIDPQERLFMQSVWSVIEDAGYTRDILRKKYPKSGSADVGVYVGVTTNSYHLLAPEQWSRGNAVSPSAMPWSIANRVSYFFDFQGPSMPIDTACSSSLVALHLACESLRRRECGVAVVGGVNLYLHPSKYQSFCRKHMVSQTGKTCSFGSGDDGFVPGEGVGSVLVKPLTRAIADRDHIYAVIVSSEFDHAGRSNGYSAPNPNSQANLISRTLEKARIHPESISYVEGHGTGTQLGDSLEITALTQAFRRQTNRRQICPIGSVKSNIGHSESAAGIAGIVKVLLQMKNQALVPSIHSNEINPNIDFEGSPFFPQHSFEPWKSTYPRRALINSFGAGGVNACIVIQEFEQEPMSSVEVNNNDHLIVLSARNSRALHEVVDQLTGHLKRQKNVDLARLSYTLQVGREAMHERLAVVCADEMDLLNKLDLWLERKESLPNCGIFQGTIPGSKVLQRLPNKEEARLVQRLVASLDWVELASIWIKGKFIDWEILYPSGGPGKISLPTYPFELKRCWIKSEVLADSRVEPVKHAKLHPLVSYNTSTLKTISFQSELSHSEFYAIDHKINGEMTFPGAGFLEIACVCGNIASEHKVSKIKDIVWIKPLILHKDKIFVQTFMKAVGEEVEFEIVSLGEDSERVVLSEGRLSFEQKRESQFLSTQKISIESLKRACPVPVDGSYLYDKFQKSGFSYGPGFRTIQQFYTNGSFSLSKLKVPDYLQDDFNNYILHPSLIDGALQTVIGLMEREKSGIAYLPFALSEVEIVRPLPRTCYAYVEPSDESVQAKNDMKKFDIKILSEFGEVLTKISNFYVRMLDRAATNQKEYREYVS